MMRMRWPLVAAVGLASIAFAAPASASSTVSIETLSTRADLVSGGDALVAIDLPSGVSASAVKVLAGTRDVTSDFAVRPDGRFEGLVTGLPVGQTVLTARLPDGSGARLTITNHPIGGPVFSGPQLQPWPCEAGAVDAQCDKPTTYAYQYLSSSSNSFQPYDPSNPPSDVATTTTQGGQTVPFVVRVETGFEDRDQYQIAVLFDPKKPWTPWAPQPAWNGKAEVTQGAGCGNHHGATGTGPNASLDAPPSVMDQEALGLGFAVMAPALDNSSHNCNVTLQSESVEMLKEHFVDDYGPLRYTIAQGCSGGSLSQLQDANAYPGLYQGLLPSCTFPDAWSSAMDSVDCPLMEAYFEDPSRWAPGVAWNEDQIMASEGKISPTICHAWKEVFPFYQSAEPGRPSAVETKGGVLDLQDCGLNDNQIWSPSNPTGVRCSLQDAAVNIFGRRASDGYAQRPFSNVGVQYGLNALEAGTITPAQFVDLNQQVGSWDINFVWQQQRVAADHDAVVAAYRSGAVNEATNLDQVPIIDQPSGNVDIHEEYRAFALRKRLDNAHGDHGNDVIWYGLNPSFPDPLKSMDSWLTAVYDDHSDKPVAAKIAADRPATVHDICDINGQDDLGGQDNCQKLAAPGQGTRGAAGGPFATDVIDCTLKPLRRSDYFPVQFSDDQWAALQKVFPDGVCDWSKPGVGQQPTVAWQTYQDGPGGRPLGAAPRSVPFSPSGCAARTMRFRLGHPRGVAIRSVRAWLDGRLIRKVHARRGRAVRTLRVTGLPASGKHRLRIVTYDGRGRVVRRSVRTISGCAGKSKPKTHGRHHRRS